MVVQTLTHTCYGTDHVADIRANVTTKLGCGCTRSNGRRCDGTAIEWLSNVVCVRHTAKVAS